MYTLNIYVHIAVGVGAFYPNFWRWAAVGGARARCSHPMASIPLLPDDLSTATIQQCPPLPDDLIAAICAHVHLRQRLSVCAALSQAFRQEVRRLGGELTLRRPVPQWETTADMSKDTMQWSSHNGINPEAMGCRIRQTAGPFPRLGGCFCPTSLNLYGFDVGDNELSRIIQEYAPHVTMLQFHRCTGETLEWHAVLVPMLCTVTTLSWSCPRIPVHSAVSILGAFHSAKSLHVEICIMPQPMPYTTAQLRGAFLCLGGLAAMSSLRELQLIEGPCKSEKEFDCPDSWYWKSNFECDGDVISGLMLALSALSGLRSLKTDMLADWSPATATGFALMLSRMPALEILGDNSDSTALNLAFFTNGSLLWDRLGAHLGPVGHPSLRELCLRFKKPEPADLELMARSMRLFPLLQRLHLELDASNRTHMGDLGVAPGDKMSRLAHLLVSLRTHPTLRELVFADLHIPGIPGDIYSDEDAAEPHWDSPHRAGALALALAPLAGLAPSVELCYGENCVLVRADAANGGIMRVV